jgi:hypothetical protein
VFTIFGDTAIYLSKLRTEAPVYSFFHILQTVKMLSLAFNASAPIRLILKPTSTSWQRQHKRYFGPKGS